MTATEKSVLRYIIDHPRAELQKICIGVRMPVAQTQPAIASLLTRELIVMSYGTGGAGTQYTSPHGRRLLEDAFSQMADEL